MEAELQPARSEEFIVEALHKTKHRRADFACEVPELTDFLRTKARKEMETRTSACFVMVTKADPRKIAGYYTLSASVVELSSLPAEMARRLPRYPQCPVTLLGRLARDETFRGQNVGELLLMSALARALHSSQHVGSMAVITDPKNEKAARFYAKYGFVAIAPDEKRLMLPMDRIERIFGSETPKL